VTFLDVGGFYSNRYFDEVFCIFLNMPKRGGYSIIFLAGGDEKGGRSSLSQMRIGRGAELFGTPVRVLDPI